MMWNLVDIWYFACRMAWNSWKKIKIFIFMSYHAVCREKWVYFNAFFVFFCSIRFLSEWCETWLIYTILCVDCCEIVQKKWNIFFPCHIMPWKMPNIDICSMSDPKSVNVTIYVICLSCRCLKCASNEAKMKWIGWKLREIAGYVVMLVKCKKVKKAKNAKKLRRYAAAA